MFLMRVMTLKSPDINKKLRRSTQEAQKIKEARVLHCTGTQCALEAQQEATVLRAQGSAEVQTTKEATVPSRRLRDLLEAQTI
jgi:hypothetical protein